jgi:dUTP pyrophosphatase
MTTECPVIVPVMPVSGKLPRYMTENSSGADLCAAEYVSIESGGAVLVKTGLRMAIPKGYEGQIRSRSGLALKGVFVLNSPGTIDADYRGEIGVILANFSARSVVIEPGDRIAQIVIQKVPYTLFVEVENLNDNTPRGSKGFGSTGP